MSGPESTRGGDAFDDERAQTTAHLARRLGRERDRHDAARRVRAGVHAVRDRLGQVDQVGQRLGGLALPPGGRGRLGVGLCRDVRRDGHGHGQRLVQRAAALGYDVTKLEFPEQPRR